MQFVVTALDPVTIEMVTFRMDADSASDVLLALKEYGLMPNDAYEVGQQADDMSHPMLDELYERPDSDP